MEAVKVVQNAQKFHMREHKDDNIAYFTARKESMQSIEAILFPGSLSGATHLQCNMEVTCLFRRSPVHGLGFLWTADLDDGHQDVMRHVGPPFLKMPSQSIQRTDHA
jgi:hypothetical protein